MSQHRSVTLELSIKLTVKPAKHMHKHTHTAWGESLKKASAFIKDRCCMITGSRTTTAGTRNKIANRAIDRNVYQLIVADVSFDRWEVFLQVGSVKHTRRCYSRRRFEKKRKNNYANRTVFNANISWSEDRITMSLVMFYVYMWILSVCIGGVPNITAVYSVAVHITAHTAGNKSNLFTPVQDKRRYIFVYGAFSLRAIYTYMRYISPSGTRIKDFVFYQ